MSESESAALDPQGPGGALDLETVLKESKGKDKKITLQSEQLKSLRSEVDRYQNALAGKTDEEVEEVKRLTEIATTLKERETLLTEQQKAIDLALEKGIPPRLLLRGTKDLDGFLADLSSFEQVVLSRTGHRLVAKPQGEGKLTAADLQKMKRSELQRVPISILERLGKVAGDGV